MDRVVEWREMTVREWISEIALEVVMPRERWGLTVDADCKPWRSRCRDASGSLQDARLRSYSESYDVR